MHRAARPALFLDRDGVINVDYGFVHRIEHFHPMPGIFELARFATATLGWTIVVVTNQSGIGRGHFDEEAYRILTEWMLGLFDAEGAPIAGVYHCPYHPEHGIGAYRRDHPWRKPRPGMILQAAADLNLDLSRSALIGDSLRDIRAGAAAGIPLLIRLDPDGRNDQLPGIGYEAAADLKAATAILRGRHVGVKGSLVD